MSNTVVIDTCTLINLKNLKRIDIIENLKYNLITTIHVLIEIKNGRRETQDYFEKLKRIGRISHINLSIEDLIEMASVPESKKISDAELSCFIKAKNIGCKTFSDDKTAIKYANKHIELGEIKGIVDIIKEAYLENIIGDDDVTNFQNILKQNKFTIAGNLLENLAAEKLKNYMIANN